MTPTAESKSVWTYLDLGLFAGSILPCMLLGLMFERLGRLVAPAVFSTPLTYMCWLYLLWLGVLYLLAVKRHGQPLWKSLGWFATFPGPWWCVFLAPLLAISITAGGALLRAPLVPTPVEELLTGNVPLIVIGFFATIIGPAFEELFFRGFLQTLFLDALKPVGAITLTAFVFALVHGPQYEWSWKHLLLLFLAGSAFGFTRHRAGSTAASALLHMGYNLTLFAAFLAQRQL